ANRPQRDRGHGSGGCGELPIVGHRDGTHVAAAGDAEGERLRTVTDTPESQREIATPTRQGAAVSLEYDRLDRGCITDQAPLRRSVQRVPALDWTLVITCHKDRSPQCNRPYRRARSDASELGAVSELPELHGSVEPSGSHGHAIGGR